MQVLRSLWAPSLYVLLLCSPSYGQLKKVDCGGPATSTTTLWLENASGYTPTNLLTYVVPSTQAIANANPLAVYQNARRGLDFTYRTTLTTGQYKVRLMFAELAVAAVGHRKMTVQINGTTVLSNWDLFVASGGAYRALDKIFTVSTVSGAITIRFIGVVGEAMINGIEFTPATTSTTTTTSASVAVTVPDSTLFQGQAVTAKATLTGISSTTPIVWSIAPAAGTISSTGLYTAPAKVTSAQTVAITATAGTVKGSATIQLQVDVTAPTVQFLTPVNDAKVGGKIALTSSATDNVKMGYVQYYLNGIALGAMLSTAPYTLAWDSKAAQNGVHKLTATAQDSSGNRASKTININVDNSVPPIVLPIEVLGPDGTVKSVSFSIPEGEQTNSVRLWAQIHALDYEDKASVQLNGSAWIALTNDTFQIEGRAKSHNGIGGPFHTIKGWVRLPIDALVAGGNTLRFRFNRTNGISSGYRVLKFNLLRSDDSPILASSLFVEDDPRLWAPPLGDSASISAGRNLWKTGSLTTPTRGAIKATCSHCHAQDGRDLKYFNYSNASIRARSVFHGLSQLQGDQIASFIRSLDMPNPGRPWNPPYQPGPGMDSKPVSEWAAGAGLDAVTETDIEVVRDLVERAYSGKLSATANLSAREIPIPLQFPDWNMWLPIVHPIDAFPTFVGSKGDLFYQTARAHFEAGKPYKGINLDLSGQYTKELLTTTQAASGFTWTQDAVHEAYSVGLWRVVKEWEIMQEFNLEPKAREYYGAQSDPNAWTTANAFHASPIFQKIPFSGLRDGTKQSYFYLAFIWYHVQLVLNNSNGRQDGPAPLDWPYTYGILKDLSWNTPDKPGYASMFVTWLAKAIQTSTLSGKGPEKGVSKLGWGTFDVSRLEHDGWHDIWSTTDHSTRMLLTKTLMNEWLGRVELYTAEQFYLAKHATPDEIPVGFSTADGRWVDRLWATMVRLRMDNLDAATLDRMVRFTKKIWPKHDWSSVYRTTCWRTSGNLVKCQLN